MVWEGRSREASPYPDQTDRIPSNRYAPGTRERSCRFSANHLLLVLSRGIFGGVPEADEFPVAAHTDVGDEALSKVGTDCRDEIWDMRSYRRVTARNLQYRNPREPDEDFS